MVDQLSRPRVARSTGETDTTPLVRPNWKCSCSLEIGVPRDPSLRDAQRREEDWRDGRQRRVQSIWRGVRCVADTRRLTRTAQRPQPLKTVRATATAQCDCDKTVTHNRTPAQAHTHFVTQWYTHAQCPGTRTVFHESQTRVAQVSGFSASTTPDRPPWVSSAREVGVRGRHTAFNAHHAASPAAENSQSRHRTERL